MGDVGSLPQAMEQLMQSIEQLTRALWPFSHAHQVAALLLKDSLGLVLKVWFDFVLRTADIDTQPPRDFIQTAAIQRFEPTVQLVADSLLVLVVIWASYRIMWAHGVRSQFTARVLLPRVFMGAVLINFSQPMFQAAVTASNTLCDVIIKFDTIADWPSWWRTFSINPQDSVLQVVTTMALVLGYDVLAVAYVVRFTVLIVLAISAPLAGQLFVIAIGFALENTGAVPLRHVFALAALLVVFKVPGAMGSAEKVAHKLESMLSSNLTHAEHSVVRAL